MSSISDSADRRIRSRSGPVILTLGGAAWVAALLLLAFHVTSDSSSQRIGIRWVPAITDAERLRVEQQAGLTAAEPHEQRTWTYLLRDRSRNNIKRLVSNPLVEDTAHIDRARFVVELDRPDLPSWLRSLEETGRILPLTLFLSLVGGGAVWGARAALLRTAAATRRLVEAAAGDEVGPRRRLTLFLLTTTIFTIAFGGFLHTTSDGDMDFHIKLAQDITSVRDITTPHVLFELLVKALHVATRLPYQGAAALVLGLSYGMMALLVARELDRRGVAVTAFRAFVLVPSLLLASHIYVATLEPKGLYLGYFAPLAYHNPTQQLNKLFALWVVFAYFAYCLDSETLNRRRSLALGTLCVLSALSKPNFLIAFLPTVGVFTLRDAIRKRWRNVAMVSAATIAPAAVVLLVQALFAYGSDASNSIVFSPFAVFDARETLVKLPMSLAFPIIAAVAAWRSHTWTGYLSFTWIYVIVATFITLGFAEAGSRMMHRNFAWTGQTAAFLAYVESALFLIGHSVGIGWSRAAWRVFAIHVVCGIVWYALVFSPNWHHYMGI